MADRKRVSHEDYNGLKAKNLGAPTAGSTEAARIVDVETASTADRSRTNHSGTQLANTISDFDTQVRTSRLDQLAAPTAAVSLNSQKVTNLAAATADTDAANLGQIKDLLSGQRKTDVRLVASSTVTGSGLAAIDGITPVAGDRVLRTADGASNGIWLAASGAWTRATDADASAEFTTQWLVTVTEGTAHGDSLWQHTTPASGVTVTLGTTPLTFNKFGPISAAAATGYAANSPVVTAGGTWTVTHNLGTEDVQVQVRRAGSPKDFIDVYAAVSDANNVTVQPDIAMASGEYRVLVTKVA